MIKNIKTKETIKDIKTLDKKKTLIKSKVSIQKIMYRMKRKIRSQIMQ